MSRSSTASLCWISVKFDPIKFDKDIQRETDMADYQADFYLNDKRLCSLWVETDDEREIYKIYAEPLFRHGCGQGLSLKYQKMVFGKSFLKIIEDKNKNPTRRLTPDEISALVTTYLLVKKFNMVDAGKMEVIIIKDKFRLKRKDAFKERKKDMSKVIETNVKYITARSQERTKGRKRTRKRF